MGAVGTHLRGPALDVLLLVERGEVPKAGAHALSVYPLLHAAGGLGSAPAGLQVESILPPYVGLVVDARVEEVRVWNDYVGVGRVYFAEDSDAVYVGSRTGLIQLASGRFTDVDEQALAIFGAAGWILGDRTPFAGVRQLDAHGTIRVATGRGARVATTIVGGGSEVVLGALPPDPRRVAEDLLGTARAIGAVAADRALTIGLSGGRDSRLVASLLARACVPFEMSTTETYPAETEVAKLVASVVAPGRLLTVREKAEPRAPGDLEASAAALVAHHEGMYEPAYVGRVQPRAMLLPQRAASPSVGGAAGELAHGHYYHPLAESSLLALTSVQAVAHLVKRTTTALMFTDAGLDALRDHMNALGQEASAHGFEGAKVLDWFYLRERLRRWSGLGDVARWNIAPLASAAFGVPALAQSVPSALASSLHRELIEVLQPALAGVPFFKATGAAVRPTPGRPPLPVSPELYDRLLSGPQDSVVNRERVRLALDQAKAGTASGLDEAVVRRALWLLETRELAARMRRTARELGPSVPRGGAIARVVERLGARD